MKKPQPKGWPRLDLYLHNVGGSRRRGRNAVNLWAAATLCRAQERSKPIMLDDASADAFNAELRAPAAPNAKLRTLFQK